jgi:RNA-directed DNA polymerase
MQESHRKDLASHPDPESCAGSRKALGEALTGAHAGQPSSCEITVSEVPTLSTHAEGNTVGGAMGKPPVDLAQSKTLRMRGYSLHGNREVPRTPAAFGARVGRRRSMTVRPACTPVGSRMIA